MWENTLRCDVMRCNPGSALFNSSMWGKGTWKPTSFLGGY